MTEAANKIFGGEGTQRLLSTPPSSLPPRPPLADDDGDGRFLESRSSLRHCTFGALMTTLSVSPAPIFPPTLESSEEVTVASEPFAVPTTAINGTSAGGSDEEEKNRDIGAATPS